MGRQHRGFTAVIALLLLAATSTGCGVGFSPVAFSDANEVLEHVDQNGKFELTDRPQCEVDFADYVIDTQLLAFEIQDKSNISFGFNLVSGFLKALGLSIKTKTGKMAISMHLEESLRPTVSVVDTLGEGTSKENEFNINLSALQLGLDIGYYYNTPLFKLTEKSINSGLKNLRAELNKVETDWSSKIVWKNGNSEFIVPAGTVAGLRIGDQFKIYNTEYVWVSEPCLSELLLVKKTTDTPLAIAEVRQIEKNAAMLVVKEFLSDEEIFIGAKVEPHLLPLSGKKDVRALARSVRVRDVLSNDIPIEGQTQTVSLSLYLREQLEGLLSGYNLYPRK